MAKRLAFMDPLVLAIAAGEKTVTRRLTDPKLQPGDVVDVCEALVPSEYVAVAGPDPIECVTYRCDGTAPRDAHGYGVPWPWKVRTLIARYCPAWAVRHRIRVVDVRRELLSAITDDDARREGIARMGLDPTAAVFVPMFRRVHGMADDADPVVFRIEFERVAS